MFNAFYSQVWRFSKQLNLADDAVTFLIFYVQHKNFDLRQHTRTVTKFITLYYD
jgi:hypothetical protein